MMADAVDSFLTPQRFEQLYSDDCKPYFEYWFGEAIQKSVPTVLHVDKQLGEYLEAR